MSEKKKYEKNSFQNRNEKKTETKSHENNVYIARELYKSRKT